MGLLQTLYCGITPGAMFQSNEAMLVFDQRRAINRIDSLGQVFKLFKEAGPTTSDAPR